MSGIASSGLISGIDTASLIDQLLSISARPRTSAQARVAQLQTQQAAVLDINSRLSALRTASQEFRTSFTFDTKRARSSDEGVLTARASNSAVSGSYRLLVDRLVSTQQRLSTGFTDRDTSAFGATSFTFESEQARLDRDTALTDLNGGGGVRRGVITLRDTNGLTAEVDLSRAATVTEVLNAINNAATDVTARVDGDRFVLENVAQVTGEPGGGTLEDLGLDVAAVGGTITGERVYALGSTTALRALNDGNGVDVSATSDVSLTVRVTVGGATTSVNVNLGEVRGDADGDPDTAFTVIESAPSTVGGVLTRINDALSDAGFGTRASIDESAGALRFTTDADESIEVIERNGSSDFGTARDLGVRGLTVGVGSAASGEAVFGGLNTVLLKSLGGGAGTTLAGTGVLEVRLRSGDDVTVDLSGARTVAEAIEAINAAADAQVFGQLRARLNSAGTGLELEDTTGDVGNLIVADNETSRALGLATEAAGVAASVVGGNAQRRYVSEGTLLSALNGGQGVGTGTILVTSPSGSTLSVTIDGSTRTVRDLLDKLGNAPGIDARINDTGDGIVVEATETGGAIRLEDTSGNVARSLKIAGVADLTDGAANSLEGRFETTVEFEATDTLDDAVTKINAADAGVRVSVVNDGSAVSPFRLSFAATRTGQAGRVSIDTGGFDLGLLVTDRGEDARVFFGGSTPAESLLVTSSSNTVDGLVDGVDIDLVNADDGFVTLTVESDTEAIDERVTAFIDAYNTVVDRIGFQTRFVAETNERGPLQGDATVFTLRNALNSTVLSANRGFSGRFNRLAEIGVTVGEGGRLELNADRFREALETDRDAVESLFTRREAAEGDSGEIVVDGEVIATVSNPSTTVSFDALGVVPLIEQLADTYTRSIDGIFTLRSSAIDAQIEGQRDRIDTLTEQLDAQRARLERQFVGLEQALAQLQSQQSALASLSSVRR